MKILPVRVPKSFVSSFFYALPMACLSADADYSDWLNENYLDFYAYRNEMNTDKYEFRFLDAVSYVDRYAHTNEAVQINRFDVKFFKEDSFHSFVRNGIDQWMYTVVFLDENMIPGSPFFDMGHEYLIYGYDDDKREYYMIGMDRHRVYSKFKFPYDCIEKGFRSFSKDNDRAAVYQLCIANRYTSIAKGENRYYSHHIVRLYDEDIFLRKLRCYAEGKVSPGNVKIINRGINSCLSCGIEVYRIIDDYLDRVEKAENAVEYNVPYYLLDNKKGLRDRLDYAYSKTGRKIYGDAAAEYAEIVEKCVVFKNRHMMLFLRDGNKVDALRRIAREMENAEREVLKRVVG